MAKDHQGRASIGEHLGRNIAGEGTAGLSMAVLPAQFDLAAQHLT